MNNMKTPYRIQKILATKNSLYKKSNWKSFVITVIELLGLFLGIYFAIFFGNQANKLADKQYKLDSAQASNDTKIQNFGILLAKSDSIINELNEQLELLRASIEANDFNQKASDRSYALRLLSTLKEIEITAKQIDPANHSSIEDVEGAVIVLSQYFFEEFQNPFLSRNKGVLKKWINAYYSLNPQLRITMYVGLPNRSTISNIESTHRIVLEAIISAKHHIATIL